MSTPGEIAAQIRSQLPSLLPAERAVAEVLLTRPAEVIEMSSAQVAAAAGASRATVVRTSQRLGYSGYLQLRVMLARDLGTVAAGPPSGAEFDDSAAGTIRALFARVGDSLPAMPALLADGDLDRAVALLAGAPRVVVVGNGLSGPLAQLAAQRLASIGQVAEAPTDVMAQQINARHLPDGGVLLVVSGSGANAASLRSVTAARAAGAAVVLITAFGASALGRQADVALVVGMRDLTFRDELVVTTRIPQLILLEGLVTAVERQIGTTAERAHALSIDVLGDNLAE